MPVLKGIKENVHLPLYDSLFVRPRKQLRDIESSNIFKFFVSVQGKTRLETNMQSASLLPHWNTFEARALRVVISDLPPQFPVEIERCLKIAAGSYRGSGQVERRSQLDEFSGSNGGDGGNGGNGGNKGNGANGGNGAKPAPHIFDQARKRIEAFRAALAETGEQNLDRCFDLLRAFCDRDRMGRILQMHRNLRLLRDDLAVMIRRSKAKTLELEALNQFADQLDAMSEATGDSRFIKQLDEFNDYLDAVEKEVGLAKIVREISFADVQAILDYVEHTPNKPSPPKSPPRGHAPERIRGRLPEHVLQCLKEHVRNELKFPLADQLFGNGTELFARFIFNSVTTLFVGEKNMIQMPTWFFPSGAGPYSGSGHANSHGFPAPEATFRFAEPVLVDAQQNFRVEIEIPEHGALGELQHIYGPFFIWVVLDGYMRRDVQ